MWSQITSMCVCAPLVEVVADLVEQREREVPSQEHEGEADLLQLPVARGMGSAGARVVGVAVVCSFSLICNSSCSDATAAADNLAVLGDVGGLGRALRAAASLGRGGSCSTSCWSDDECSGCSWRQQPRLPASALDRLDIGDSAVDAHLELRATERRRRCRGTTRRGTSSSRSNPLGRLASDLRNSGLTVGRVGRNVISV